MKYLNSIYDSSLSPTEILVYLFLKDHSNKKGECFHSKRSIAKALNSSTKPVQRSLRALELSEFITTQKRFRKDGGQSSNLYSLIEH